MSTTMKTAAPHPSRYCSTLPLAAEHSSVVAVAELVERNGHNAADAGTAEETSAASYAAESALAASSAAVVVLVASYAVVSVPA